MKEIKCPICISTNCYTYPDYEPPVSTKLFNCRNCGLKFAILRWSNERKQLKYNVGVC